MSSLQESPEHWQDNLYLQFYHHENHIRQKRRHAHHVRRGWMDVNGVLRPPLLSHIDATRDAALIQSKHHFLCHDINTAVFCTILT